LYVVPGAGLHAVGVGVDQGLVITPIHQHHQLVNKQQI
jgi:hypothetical protein